MSTPKEKKERKMIRAFGHFVSQQRFSVPRIGSILVRFHPLGRGHLLPSTGSLLAAQCRMFAKRRCGNVPNEGGDDAGACENEVVDRTCVCLLCVSLICVRHGLKMRCVKEFFRGCLCEYRYTYLCMYTNVDTQIHKR